MVIKGLISLSSYPAHNSPNIIRSTYSETYNQFHNILRLFDVLQIFLSLQLKRWSIITYKHGIYELPHECRIDLRLRILGN